VVTRLILLIILGFVAALYFPDSRQAMWNRTMPVIEPVLIWNAEREIEELSRGVRREARDTFQPPETRTWASWLTVNFSGNATTDPWGKTYSYRAWPDSFRIRSDGPDRLTGSEDDISRTKYRPF
jgi:hypothetical protein